MKRGDCGSSSRTSRSWRIATFRTASPIKVPGQTALRSSSFLTSWPGRPTRWSSTAKALGRSFISCEPFQRHSLAKSRQKGSKTIRFPFSTLVTEGYRNLADSCLTTLDRLLSALDEWNTRWTSQHGLVELSVLLLQRVAKMQSTL